MTRMLYMLKIITDSSIGIRGPRKVIIINNYHGMNKRARVNIIKM